MVRLSIGKIVFLPIVILTFGLNSLWNHNDLKNFVAWTGITLSLLVFVWEDFLEMLEQSGLPIGKQKSLIDLQNSDTGSTQLKERKVPLLWDFFQKCLENEDTRKITIFFVINWSFMFVEFFYGFYTNSLGLITDSFHMLFDCLALFIGLCASYMAKAKRNKSYTFGYERLETLSGFFNGIFLIMIAMMIIVDSIVRMIEPQVIHTDGLILVAFLGLCVNMIGLIFFHDHHHHGSGGSHNFMALQNWTNEEQIAFFTKRGCNSSTGQKIFQKSLIIEEAEHSCAMHNHAKKPSQSHEHAT